MKRCFYLNLTLDVLQIFGKTSTQYTVANDGNPVNIDDGANYIDI